MGNSEALTLFLSDFDQQLSEIKKIYALLEKKMVQAEKEQISSELIDSLGYWLHNLYSAYEDLFRIIAAFWENSLQNASAYHIQLLRRMRLEIPGVRPAVIKSEPSFIHLDELRAFRHVFRHAYSYGLDDERIFFLLRKVFRTKESLLEELAAFRTELECFVNPDPET